MCRSPVGGGLPAAAGAPMLTHARPPDKPFEPARKGLTGGPHGRAGPGRYAAGRSRYASTTARSSTAFSDSTVPFAPLAPSSVSEVRSPR